MPMSRRIKQEAVPLEVPSISTRMEIADDDDRSNDDGNEIVREIDVMVTPELYTQMYLMQYPLHHHPIAIPDSAKIKPRHRMIELEQPLPANSGNEGGFRMSHRTYTSRIVPISTHLAIGKMEPPQDGSGISRLYLVPLSNVMQMRPSFAHIDEAMASSTRNDSDNEEMEDREHCNKVEKKPVLLHKKESERAALNRRSSYAFKKASEDSEEWKPLEIFAPDSQEHSQVLSSIHDVPIHENIINVEATGNYIQSLNYLPVNLTLSVSTSAAAAPSAHTEGADNKLNEIGDDNADQNNTALCVKLVGLLRKGLPVPFGIIKSNFEDTDSATLFSVLSSCALLVRGNFVLQSRLLPLPPNVQLARTFLLYLFQSTGIVSRPRLVCAFEKYDSTVTATIIYGLLQQLGQKVAFGWTCKVGDNADFCQTFPEQTQLYQQYWERQSARFEKLWKLYHNA